MKIEPKKTEPNLTPSNIWAKRRPIIIGVVLGGVIGVTLGLIIVSLFRGSGEGYSEPVAPIRALPPRPISPSATK